MEGDDFVAEDVVASRERGWNSDGPGVVVGNHVENLPLGLVIVVRRLIDLDPFEGRLVGRRAVTSALCDVGEDGADVGLWPGSPLEVNLATSSDSGSGSTRSGVLVAVDIRRGIGAGSDEAVVEVLSIPSWNGWESTAVGLGVVVFETESTVVDVVSNDTGDGTVSSNSSSESADGESGRLGKHGEVF